MPTTKLWIHIGMPKTGTSSLQELFSWNREKLAEHGYLYPDFGSPQHFPLVRSLAREVGSPAGFPHGGADLPIEGIKETIHSAVLRRKITNVVLSSEFFFDYPGLTPGRPEFPIDQAIPYLRGVASLLRETFPDYEAYVVVWLRRQDHWLMSMYNNAVKVANYKRDFDVFYKHQVAPWYGRILDQWGDIFGKEKLKIFVYEKDNRGLDVVPEFLRLIEFPEHVILDKPNHHVREGNIGLSRELLIIKRELNRSMPEHMPGLRQSIEDLVFSLAKQEAEVGKRNVPIISSEQRRSILQKFSGENQHVLERFLDSSRPGLFMEPLPEDTDWEKVQSISGDMLLRIFAPLLLSQAKRIRSLENRLKRETL